MTDTLTYNRKADWLGNFPKHWQIKRIKNLFTEVDERSVNGDEELLSVSQYTGITPKRDCLENEDDFISNAESLEGYKKVTQGDLVINIMLAWNGSLGISPYNGIVSPAYCVYRCLPGNNPEYFGYLFSTALYKAVFRRNSTGVIDSRLRLYSDKFFGIHSVVPSLNEQNKIVEHINIQSEKINCFINAKLRFIELLKEQRQGKIDHLIMQGTNSNIELKSTQTCLGSIPYHWEIRRFKIISDIRYGLGQPPREMEGGLPLIRATNIDAGKISEKNLIFVDPDDVPWDRDPELKENDIIVVRSGALTGDSCIIPKKYEGAITGYDMVLRTKIGNPEFVAYYLLSSFALFQIYMLRQRAAQPHLNKEELDNVKIPFPPFEEQTQIVEHIKAETEIIDIAIAKAEREIELIREYKEAMIAEAVMGIVKNK